MRWWLSGGRPGGRGASGGAGPGPCPRELASGRGGWLVTSRHVTTATYSLDTSPRAASCPALCESVRLLLGQVSPLLALRHREGHADACPRSHRAGSSLPQPPSAASPRPRPRHRAAPDSLPPLSPSSLTHPPTRFPDSSVRVPRPPRRGNGGQRRSGLTGLRPAAGDRQPPRVPGCSLLLDAPRAWPRPPLRSPSSHTPSPGAHPGHLGTLSRLGLACPRCLPAGVSRRGRRPNGCKPNCGPPNSALPPGGVPGGCSGLCRSAGPDSSSTLTPCVRFLNPLTRPSASLI